MTPADIIRLKELLPTSLGSGEIREKFAREILQRSVFSAKMASAAYLSRVKEVCAAFASGEINESKARERLLRELARMGLPTEETNDLADPASERRLNLIVETQREMAASVAQIAAQNEGTVAAYPAWELCRLAGRRVPREDWPQRWRAAGESVGWDGAYDRAVNGSFVALKASPIWQALGDGAGGFRDTLGNPYPPFAYSSGMAWLQVERGVCERLGLVDPDADAPMPDAPSLSPSERDIADAAKRCGLGEDYFNDVLEGL